MVIINSSRIILSWFIFGLHSTVTQGRSEMEAKLQCVAGCLTTFRNQANVSAKQRYIDQPQLLSRECVIKNVTKPSVCETCFNTCMFANISVSNCSIFCEKSNLHAPVCEPVCKKLLLLFTSSMSSCPAPTSLQSCNEYIKTCEHDRDAGCPNKHLCCSTERCGDVCLLVNISTEGLPIVPEAPKCTSDEVNEPTKVSLDWTNYPVKSSPHPIVFHLQYRQQLADSKLDELKMSSWKDIVYTCQQSTTITVMLGNIYQFRLLAISENGNLGYSEPSSPVTKISRHVDEPTNLREGSISLHNNLVNVELRWNGQVKNYFWATAMYKLRWRKKIYRESYDEEGPFKIETIPFKQTNFLLKGLKPDTGYEIKISTVVTYEKLILTSRDFTLNIRTPRIPKKTTPTPAFSMGIRLDLESTFSQCRCGKKDSSNEPVFTETSPQGADLKMKVSWKPPSKQHRWFKVKPTSNVNNPDAESESVHDNSSVDWIASYIVEWGQKVCIDSNSGQVKSGDRVPQSAKVQYINTYEISGLQFNCHYVLRLHGLSNGGDPMVYWRTCFCTPSCREASSNSLAYGDYLCPSEVEHVPQAPLDLRYKMLPVNINTAALSVLITWTAPSIEFAISGFRITWGARIKENIPLTNYGNSGFVPQLDVTTSNSRVLDSGLKSLVLHGLSAETIYIVQVQTLTVFGDSEPSQIFFRTPNSTFKVITTIFHEEVSNHASHGSCSRAHFRSSLPLLSLAAIRCLQHLLSG